VANKRIPNDELGRWGECQFGALCAASGLVANKAEYDKMGWDFIVEKPPAMSTPALPLDQRPNGLSCRVQVKTHWQRGDDRIEMTLSAAERLAKDPAPSFVVALIADASGESNAPTLVDCYLLHMLDDNLKRVLKRLREAEADRQGKPLTEQKISYSPRVSGEQFPPTGDGLHDALARNCGSDPHVYIERKNAQLETLGYTAGRYQLKTEITANDIDELIEMMLGLRPVPITKFEAFDIRFEVPVLSDHFHTAMDNRAEFEVQPPSMACMIRVRGKGLTPPAVINGEVLLPAVQNIPEKHKRMLIKARIFQLDLRNNGRIEFRLDGEALNKIELSLEDWRNHFRLLEILGESEVEFDIEGHGPGVPRSILNLKNTVPPPHEPWLASLAEAARCGETLLQLAGTKGNAISLRRLAETAQSIRLAHARLLKPETIPPQTFRSEGQITEKTPLELDILQIDCAMVAGEVLAYASRLTMRPEPVGDGILWRQIDSRFQHLQIISKTVKAFKAFAASVQEQAGLQNTMVRDVGNIDDEILE
jgi:hypothetical protein